MLETSLYPVVKRFLETGGFRVKGEVNGCDAVAIHDGDGLRLAIVEMKLGFTLDLLLQAVDRMRTADEAGWRCRQPGAGATVTLACIGCAD